MAERFLGCLPRDHDLALDLDDFGVARPAMPSWSTISATAARPTAGCTRCSATRTAHSGHAAETSFGAHIFNTPMTYRDEPQSYSGPPPGLSTRLFLKLGDAAARRSFALLIYPASAPWHARSATTLLLHDGDRRADRARTPS